MAPGMVQRRPTTWAHALTGHILSLVANCVTVSIFSPFFCVSKVMETVWACSKSDIFLLLMIFPSVRKTMCLMHISFVFRSPAFAATCRYSHDRIPKKSAPQARSATVLSSFDVAEEYSPRKTLRGRAGCRLVGVSSSSNRLYRRVRVMWHWPSASTVGLAIPNVRKVCATLDTVVLTVSFRSLSLVVLPN